MRDEIDMRLQAEHGPALSAAIDRALGRIAGLFRRRPPAASPEPRSRTAQFAICGERLCGAGFQRWY